MAFTDDQQATDERYRICTRTRTSVDGDELSRSLEHAEVAQASRALATPAHRVERRRRVAARASKLVPSGQVGKGTCDDEVVYARSTVLVTVTFGWAFFSLDRSSPPPVPVRCSLARWPHAAAAAVCFEKIQRCRGAGACLWLVAALCVSRTHRTTRKSWPAFLTN